MADEQQLYQEVFGPDDLEEAESLEEQEDLSEADLEDAEVLESEEETESAEVLESEEETADWERQQISRAAQSRVDQVYQDLFAGQTNPYTGEPIRTEEDYQRYQQQHQEEEEADELRQSGISPERFQEMIDRRLAQHPAMLQAQRITMEAAAAQARAAQEAAQRTIAEGLAEISAEWPEIQSLEDIAALPTSGRFDELIRKGLGLVDAFYLANRETFRQREMAAARQAGVNAARGKSHLHQNITPSGADALDVPPEMVRSYRAIMPDATEAEIRAAYRKYLKDLKH